MSVGTNGRFVPVVLLGLGTLSVLVGCSDETRYRTEPCPCEGTTDSQVQTDSCLPSDSDDDTGTAPPSTVILGDSRYSIEALAMDFVEVTAGEFTMGCTPGQEDGCESDENASHRVTLTRAFWVGTTEVTQGQYRAVMGEHRSGNTTCGDACPVEVLTWHQAAAYTNGVSELEGLERCYVCEETGTGPRCNSVGDPYTCQGYRLPTESEWEGAARCGTDLMFSGSDAFEEVAWTADTADASTHPVASLAPNSCEIYDMSGNVWEWVGDWFSDYDGSDVIDPLGPETGDTRVYRGGSWGNSTRRSRTTNRHQRRPTFHYSLLGVRLVRTIP